MFIISNVIIDERIAYVNFACDLNRCKGACCTIPYGRGAPITNEEVAEIKKVLPIIKKYLSPLHQQALEIDEGIEGVMNDYTTSCIGNKDCIFVYYDGDIAKCAFEKAYLDKEIQWRKPLSCHLFPIRVSYFGGDTLRFERLADCKPAFEKGAKESVKLYSFLKDALIRAYGLKWYEEIVNVCEKFLLMEAE